MSDSEDRPRTLTKDELNLAEFPFALPCLRTPKSCTEIRIFEVGLDAAGRPVHREWAVHPSHRGLPLALDEEVFLGLVHLLHQQTQFKERHIQFTQHHLFSILGWGGGQWAYERLEQSLIRLKGSLIQCKDSFWDHKGKCYVSRGFSLLDNFALYRRDDTSAEKPFLSSVTFNEAIFESFSSGFIKSLDLSLYLSLRLPISRRLFRLLDKKLYKAPVYEIELMRLASRIALTDRAYPADVKKHLAGAHAELEKIGFLKGASYIKRGTTASIRYTMNPREAWKPAARKIAHPGENPLVHELTSRGITPLVARALLKEHGEQRVADKLEVFDYLVSEKSQQVSRNPAGFLRISIEKNFAPPPGYVSRAERQRRKEEEAEARRRERELAKAQEQTEREQREHFEVLWASMSATEREQLENEVLVTLNAFTRKALQQEKAAGRVGPAHVTLRTGIAKLLTERRGLAVASMAAPVRELV